MTEWTKVLVLKASVFNYTGGSNPSLSEIYLNILGFEPKTNGLKVRCSDQLSYTSKKIISNVGFEPTTFSV